MNIQKAEGKERFLELVEKNKEFLVVVEGKKDKEALEKLGFKRIKYLNKALYKIVEEVVEELGKRKEEKVLILTDLDKKGEEIYKILNSALQARGIKVDDRLRKFLRRNSKIRQIEGLRRHF